MADLFSSFTASAIAIIAALGYVARMVGFRVADRDVDRERGRLLAELGYPEDAKGPVELPHGGSREVVESEQFTRLLVDYYAHGLAQAKRNSGASLASSGLGAGVLLAGVALAIFRADSSGQQYASIVVTTSGVLTNAIGVLFHRQANRALTHMEGQTRLLRQDMKSEREARQALELLSEVEDSELRDHLRAGLILRLADADLPKPGEDVPQKTRSRRSTALGVVDPASSERPAPRRRGPRGTSSSAPRTETTTETSDG